MIEKESIFLKALNKETLPVPPIWYMRQAGRYMPEYRAVRKNFKNFLDMCKEPEVCCELALQPINAFELDSAILFSDILTIPDAMGLDVNFLEGEGPVFGNPIKTARDVLDIEDFDTESLSYVYKAVTNIKNALPTHIPLIGFCGSPWTLAAYSIEGGGSKDFHKTKTFMREHPKELQNFLEILSKACFEYLRQQVMSGVNAIQIFDSWADLLSGDNLETFSLKYTRILCKLLKEDPVTADIPIILFEKSPNKKLEDIVFKEITCISLYWQEDIESISKNFKDQYAIQGNLDPKVLLKSDESIWEATQRICNIMKEYPGFIFNLGHGITPDIDPNKVQVMIDAIRQ